MKQLLLSGLVLSPLLGVLVLTLIPKEKLLGILRLGILATLPPLLLVVYLLVSCLMGSDFSDYNVTMTWFQFSSLNPADYGKIFAVDYELVLDGLSFVLVALTTVLTFLAACASSWIKRERKGYFMLLLLLESALLGVFLAGNLILFFIFFGLALLITFFLIGKWGGEQREGVAFRFLAYSGLASVVLLFGVMTLMARLGTSNIEVLSTVLPQKGIEFPAPVSDAMRMVLFMSTAIPFLILLPSVPLHAWLLKVHRQTPIPILMLLTGVLLKVGAYGMIRISMSLFPDQFGQAAPYLAGIGVLNLLYGTFLALTQKDFRSFLAYFSLSHMGLVLMGLGSLNEMGVQGAMVQLFSHGLIIAFLLFVIGVLENRLGTNEVHEVSGLSKVMPNWSGFFLLSGLAAVGVPGSSAFVSGLLVYIGFFQTNRFLASIATVALLLMTFGFLKMVLKMNYGVVQLPMAEGERSIKDLSLIEWIPALFLFIGIVLNGVIPYGLNYLVEDVVTTIMNGLGG